MTCFSVIGIICSLILRQQDTDIPVAVDHICFILVSFGCVWSLLYFFQVVPWMSIYVIAVQRMLQDFVWFMFIFLLFFSVFILSFHRVLMGNSVACPENFENVLESSYSTVLVMVNLMDSRSYENVDMMSLYVYALHMSCSSLFYHWIF